MDGLAHGIHLEFKISFCLYYLVSVSFCLFKKRGPRREKADPHGAVLYRSWCVLSKDMNNTLFVDQKPVFSNLFCILSYII